MNLKIRPIVFLDFDDVIVPQHAEFNSYQVVQCFVQNRLDWPELWTNIVSTEARDNLRLLTEEFSSQFVISSSWVSQLTREQIVEFLSRTQLEFVANNLHQEWRTPSEPRSRLHQIESWHAFWLEEDGPFLILDDGDSGATLVGEWPDTEGFVVFCEPGACFSGQHLEQARQILQRQMKSSAG